MKKRIISFCLVILMAFSFSTYTSATDSSSKLTPKTASEIVALSFMRNSISERVEISETTPFYDLSGNITAYCISFELEGHPSGYVLISFLNLDSPIVEFSLEGPGITNTIREMQGSFSVATKDRIVYLGADALFVEEENGDHLYDVISKKPYLTAEMDRAYRETVKFAPTRNERSVSDWILNYNDAGIYDPSIVIIPYFGNGADYWLLSDFSNGEVCAPTCATNILWYWGVKRGCSWAIENGNLTGLELAASVFIAMCVHMNTIPSLGTFSLFVPTAYYYYLASRGSNFNAQNLTQNSYSSFTSAIDDNCPIHTSLRSALISEGHDVMSFGYGESTTGTKYLFVIDGWNDYGRFLNFNSVPIVEGLKVWIGNTAN
ncbi:MAG: hypothetical protein IKX20_11640 [Paludibacteraceae bacterium]|nr:hypothetical protein [Paludibacteraceae bacterium]